MTSENPDKLLILFDAVSEETISDSQLSELDDILSSDKTACEYFLEYMNMCAALKGGKTIDEEFSFDTDEFESVSAGSPVRMDSNTSLRGIDLNQLKLDDGYNGAKDGELSQAMLELLEMERTAPAVDIPKEEPKRELIEKVESNFKLFPSRPSKRKLRFEFAMAACIMVTIGYMHFFGPKYVDRPIVATLDDSINAVWDAEFQIPGEYGVMVQSRYRLKEGYASILFNGGVKVTVEAPAELSLNSVSDMELFGGKVYAIVPQRAKGFTVTAADNKIVDLGTEFGVEVDTSGSTQLHVTKGKTLLYAGSKNNNKTPVNVSESEAKKVYNDGFVKDIKLEDSKFVRHIDSMNNLAVRDPLVEVFYEPFDYAEGFLEDVSDWVKVDGVLPDRGILVQSTGLAYGTLPSRGGRIKSGTRYDRTRGHTLNSAATAIANAGLLADGQTLWFSVVVETLVSENTSLVVALGTDYVNGYYQIDGGSGDSVGFDITNGNDFQSRYFIGGTALKSGLVGKNLSNGKPIMLVIEMIWNADNALPDTLNYYLPDEGLNMGSPVVTLNTVAFNQAAFDTFSVSVCGKIALDEIRFGKSYSDVVGGR